MTCVRRGGISKGRQLSLDGDHDTKLTVNLYHNGTVMVQRTETSLNQFQKSFRNLKEEVQKMKKDPVIKSQAEDGASAASVPITRTHGHTPASPKIKALRDNIAELEQDFFLFKEVTTNHLHHLINLTSHQSVQQIQQLCSAVRALEEDNQELRRELRRVREELARREDHGHALERLLEESRRQPHTEPQQQCVSTQTHSTSTHSTPPQRRPQSPFSAVTRQSPPDQQSLQRTGASGAQTTTSSSPTSNGREQRRQDHIAILCDSNSHHLDPRRLFPGRSVKKFWCPTSRSALSLLQEGALGSPSHIIIHTGTNELSSRRVDVSRALCGVVRTASRIYPRAKVILSSLLPRRDVPQRIINSINTELASICASIPNAHIAEH